MVEDSTNVLHHIVCIRHGCSIHGLTDASIHGELLICGVLVHLTRLPFAAHSTSRVSRFIWL
jgi:hypothetical protein